MPRFDEDVLIATEAIDDVFAEDFVLTPYAKAADVNAAYVPDTTRDTVRLRGVWISKPADAREPNAYDPREYKRPGLLSDVPHVEFATSATACFVDFAVRAGDHIKRCETGVTYQADPVLVTPNGTVRVRVNILGRS